MALTLMNIFETSLLCLNAFQIIKEDRPFKRCDDEDDDDELKKNRTKLPFEEDEAKMEVYNFIFSITTLSKFPLLILNIIAILLKLILGS